MGFGPPAGSPFAMPGGTTTTAASGLPFAGVPSELRDKAQAILDTEPEHPDADIVFSQVPQDDRIFTLARFLEPHRGRLAMAMLIVVIETVALQAGPLLTQIGIDQGVRARDANVLWWVAAAYVGAVVVNLVMSTIRVIFTGRLGERLTYELRIRVFTHMQRLGLDFYSEEKQGRLLSRMTSDIDALSVLFQDGLVNLAVQGITLVVVAVILLVLDPLLAAITMLAVVPGMVALTMWFRIASDREFGRVRDRIADVLADLSENLAGIRVLSALGRRRQNLVQHTNLVGELSDANIVASRVGTIYGPSSEAIGVLGQALLVAIGGWLVLNDRLTVGELFAFLLYLTTFFAPIQALVQLYTTYQQGQAAVTKLADLLGEEPNPAESRRAVVLPPIEGRVRLEGVTFGYDPQRPVLVDVDLEILPGEVLAVVGPTGAGKSTVAKLITRFYDPQHGTVSIDGHDLREVTMSSLRTQLGVVPQEPYLFGGTLRTNIAFARPDASDSDVRDAAEAVGLGPLIARLADGLDTVVHERGVSLSAGERQLVALARAVLARPRVLVLDEATSNLDFASERLVEQALDRVLEGRTAVIIAHRLATARRASRIAVVDDGRIVELGNHAELVAAEGRYAAMYAAWIHDATPLA